MSTRRNKWTRVSREEFISEPARALYVTEDLVSAGLDARTLLMTMPAKCNPTLVARARELALQLAVGQTLKLVIDCRAVQEAPAHSSRHESMLHTRAIELHFLEPMTQAGWKLSMSLHSALLPRVMTTHRNERSLLEKLPDIRSDLLRSAIRHNRSISEGEIDLEQLLRDTPLTLARAAEIMGVSSRSLVRKVRQRTGLSFLQLKDSVRLEEAQRRLSEGEPITEISVLLGFASTQAFTAWFHKKVGTSPARWRRRFDRNSA